MSHIIRSNWILSGPVGAWFMPPSTPHSQFGSPLSLSPSPGCEHYSTLRNHRSAPYTSPYAQWTSSPSECSLSSFTLTHPGITPFLLSLLTKKSTRCYWLWNGLHSSGLCVSHRAVNTWSAKKELHGENIHTLNICTDIRKWNALINDKLYISMNWLLKSSKSTSCASVWSAVGNSDNSSACLLPNHDNWSGLHVPPHSTMMSTTHNSSSGTNSRFVLNFFFAYLVTFIEIQILQVVVF